MTKFQGYRDAKGEYRWRLVSSNGRIIADSAEGYVTPAGCIHGMETVFHDLHEEPAPVIDLLWMEDADGPEGKK
jgi:uncharacterized protein YegP (UPF0339 family)